MWYLCAPYELLQVSRNYLLNDRIQDHLNQQILFVERLGGYRRAIGLDEKIRSKLSTIGVRFFDSSQASIEEQIAAFANAKIVVGVHGAGIANILWSQPGTKVIEIFHPKFAPWCYAILANQLKLEYYCIGNTPGLMDINFREADVVVDWNQLIKLIQRLNSYENS